MGAAAVSHGNMRQMRDIWAFAKLLCSQWMALMSSAFFTFLSIYVAAENIGNMYVVRASAAAAIFFLLVAAFRVWHSEHIRNLHGPDILIDWHHHEHGCDEIAFRNVGDEIALNVTAVDFSWDALRWHRHILIPSLDNGASRTCEAQFSREVSAHSGELGYMLHILRSPETPQTLTLSVTFESLRRQRFERVFELDLVETGERTAIRCNPRERRAFA
jgi:hypothetical protein